MACMQPGKYAAEKLSSESFNTENGNGLHANCVPEASGSLGPKWGFGQPPADFPLFGSFAAGHCFRLS